VPSQVCPARRFCLTPHGPVCWSGLVTSCSPVGSKPPTARLSRPSFPRPQPGSTFAKSRYPPTRLRQQRPLGSNASALWPNGGGKGATPHRPRAGLPLAFRRGVASRLRHAPPRVQWGGLGQGTRGRHRGPDVPAATAPARPVPPVSPVPTIPGLLCPLRLSTEVFRSCRAPDANRPIGVRVLTRCGDPCLQLATAPIRSAHLGVRIHAQPRRRAR
jgi:hypothetical protein